MYFSDDAPVSLKKILLIVVGIAIIYSYFKVLVMKIGICDFAYRVWLSAIPSNLLNFRENQFAINGRHRNRNIYEYIESLNKYTNTLYYSYTLTYIEVQRHI